MDIISLLSDDLLLQILSYVPTKDVVATSLLSKRWRSLWMLVPELEYNDNNHNGGYKSFSLFVYRSLLSNKAPVLESLCLSLGPRCPVADIGKWIDVAISSHSLLELTIDIRSSVEGPVRLPSCLYTSDTLETLILENCILLDVPSSVSLPSLVSLHLKLIRYADNTSLTALLSGCPNLENLYMERGSGDAMMDATIVLPSLQRLFMVDIDPGTCGRCVIDCSSLKYLTFCSDINYNFRQIEHIPALVEARVCTRRKVAPEFLKAFTSARRLFLWLSLSEAVPPSGIIFKQLVHLDLFTLSESWWDLLICMLQGSPKLRRLKLFEQNDGNQSGKGVPMGWKPPSSVPECLSSSLEAFKWIGYKGRQGDREMAAYFLKNAASLKTATFSPKATEVEKKYQMLKELASVPTASTSSRLLFD